VQSQTNGAMYARAAMAHGAPAPEDILFKVRVLPASTTTEDTLAPGNQPDPIKPIKAPFRRMLVDYAAPGSEFKLPLGADGRRKGAIEFSVLVYDNDGRLLNATGKTVQLNLTPETYAHLQHGIGGHLEISVPAKSESFLRIGIRDPERNRIGVVEIPVSAVARLAPPPAAPAVAPATPPPAAKP